MAKTQQEYTFNTPPTPQLPTLLNKEQLNTIIASKDGSPDYLAINIYYDSLRSWYNPKKQYQEDGNILHIRKLKSNGIYYSAEQLAKIHGCSKETIRKKLVKLENLGFIQRSYEHKSTPTTNSYNHRCIFVWRHTPHFFNPYGLDRKQIKTLKSQTNANHVENKYGVRFASTTIENKALETGGGIHTLEDTKELREIPKGINNRSKNAQAHESNSCNNSYSLISEKTINQSETSKVIPLKPKPICNKRKKPTNAEIKANKAKVFVQKEIKAQVVRPVFYAKPKSLSDMHPLLDQAIFDELRSKSGREFSNNFIAQRVLAMSKKPKLASRNFKTRQGFIAYMTPSLKNELHDSVKTGSADFRLLANMTATDRTYQEQERFLTEIENSRQVSPEWHFKKKLASVLERSKAYGVLSAYLGTKIQGNNVVISLKRDIELSEFDKQVILQQAKAVYETSSATGEHKFIDKLEIVFAEQESYVKPTNQQEQKLVLPQGIWGNILQKLIEEFGQDTYRNWFSKLTPIIDEVAKTIELKTSSDMVKDWINSKYREAIAQIVAGIGIKLKGIN
jgi:hypothetical protein